MGLLNTLRFVANHPLNREQRLRSLVRYSKWQLGSRLVPGAVVFNWINGSKFLVKPGDTGLTGNIYNGLHEFPDMGFLLHLLRKDDLFVDIGANVGSYTILACSAVGARGIAFEPIPDTWRRLVENMRLNQLEGRVRCINMGVGAREGSIAFASDTDTMNHALAPGENSASAVTVAVTSLDSALRDESPTLAKIDVEGYEAPVIEGAEQTLKKKSLQAVIMELNGGGSRYGFDESKILELMTGYGFRTYSYSPLERQLTPLAAKNSRSDNTIFVRDLEAVTERLKSSAKVSVHGRQF